MRPIILSSIADLKSLLETHGCSHICVVTSTELAQRLAWAIDELAVPRANVILLPDGEKAKQWAELEKLLERLSGLNLDRRSILIALGGGTIGDVAGFAASIYLRGIPYVQVPTTLVAQADSAHGGKTGINFLGYKNQIGSFHLPLAIVLDERFIATLSREQVIDGLGEILKAGFIRDASIIRLLEKHTVDDLIGSSDMPKILKKAIAVKDYYTKKDLKDNGSRQFLNAGHTIGHGIELKYGLSHGRAVIEGMLQELRFTESLGLTPLSVRERLMSLLKGLGIETRGDMKPDWQTVIHDKKVNGGSIDFPVITGIGKSELVELGLDSLRKFLI